MSKIKPGSSKQKKILLSRAIKKGKKYRVVKLKWRLKQSIKRAKITAQIKELGKSVNLEAAKRVIG